MRVLTLTFVLAASVALGGCFQSTAVISVNGDGTGTIEQRMLFTGAALAQMRGFAALTNGGKAFDPISEDQARQAAAALGPGVRYVSSKPISTGEALGREIVYAFSDIDQVRFNEQPPTPGGVTIRSRDLNTEESLRFELTRETDGHRLLRIVLPQIATPIRSRTPAGTPSPDEIATLKTAFAGAQLSIAVKPSGEIVKTSSTWVDNGTVTLLDLQFDKLAADDAVLARLMNVHSIDDATAALKDVPGVKINPGREITIEFIPKQ